MDIQWFNSWKLIQNISVGDILLLTTPSSETSNDWSITLLNPQLRSNDGSNNQRNLIMVDLILKCKQSEIK